MQTPKIISKRFKPENETVFESKIPDEAGIRLQTRRNPVSSTPNRPILSSLEVAWKRKSRGLPASTSGAELLSLPMSSGATCGRGRDRFLKGRSRVISLADYTMEKSLVLAVPHRMLLGEPEELEPEPPPKALPTPLRASNGQEPTPTSSPVQSPRLPQLSSAHQMCPAPLVPSKPRVREVPARIILAAVSSPNPQKTKFSAFSVL